MFGCECCLLTVISIFKLKYRPGVLESQVWAHGFLHGFVALGTYSALTSL